MSDPGREVFLANVRQAVREGNRAGALPPLPERGTLGYQGAGDDPVAVISPGVRGSWRQGPRRPR